jgi:hypothetical protein
MTEYLLAVHTVEGVENYMNEEAMQAAFQAVETFNQELQSAGAWVFGGGLHPVNTATVVDATKDETLITDGPFAESKEQLGGFWVIEAADLDAALDWAAKGSKACAQPVEVRPFQAE